MLHKMTIIILEKPWAKKIIDILIDKKIDE